MSIPLAVSGPAKQERGAQKAHPAVEGGGNVAALGQSVAVLRTVGSKQELWPVTATSPGLAGKQEAGTYLPPLN